MKKNCSICKLNKRYNNNYYCMLSKERPILINDISFVCANFVHKYEKKKQGHTPQQYINYFESIKEDAELLRFKINIVAGDINRKLRKEIMFVLTGENKSDEECKPDYIMYYLLNKQLELFWKVDKYQ